jgi:hypothetical protein
VGLDSILQHHLSSKLQQQAQIRKRSRWININDACFTTINTLQALSRSNQYNRHFDSSFLQSLAAAVMSSYCYSALILQQKGENACGGGEEKKTGHK